MSDEKKGVEAHPAPNALIHTGHDFNSECPACLREDQIYDEGYKDAELTRAHPAPAGSEPAAPEQYAKALEHFTDYFVRNYPGPDTIISRPTWHAPKIFRAALYALSHAAPVAQPSPQPSEPKWMRCEDCDGAGSTGPEIYQGDFQPPEREPCPSCSGSGRWPVEPAGKGED